MYIQKTSVYKCTRKIKIKWLAFKVVYLIKLEE